jgi:hypothetical protein
VTGNFFSALRLEPALGRLFVAGEGEYPGSEPILVLSHSTWQRRFGGDRNVVGTTVRLNGKPVRIIGVAPKEFHGLQHGVETDRRGRASIRSSCCGRIERSHHDELVQNSGRFTPERRAT